MHGLFQKTIATTSMLETQALRAIAAKVDTHRCSAAISQPPPISPPRARPTSLVAGVGFASDKWTVQSSDQSSGSGPKPFVIFNPVAAGRGELAEAVIWFDSHVWNITDEIRRQPWRVRLPDGQTIAAQNVESGHYWGHGFTRILFPISVELTGLYHRRRRSRAPPSRPRMTPNRSAAITTAST